MTPAEEKILLLIIDQLSSIRTQLHVLFGAGIVFVIVVAEVYWFSRRRSSSFPQRGEELLNKERYSDVVKAGTKYLAKYPGDVHSQWLVAQAHMRLGNWTEALSYAKRTQELRPDWGAQYTGPFIAYVEQELAKPKGRRDFRVVTPNSPPQSDAPPSGGAPLG